MANIVINASKLNPLEKVTRGQDIITKSTNNPLVPGNATVLAAFVTAQQALDEAIDAEVAARTSVSAKMTARENAVEEWVTKVNALAGFTEGATDGDAEAIESAGFAVRAPRTPPQALPPPTRVMVETNEKPGYSDLTWDPVYGAKSYVIQSTATPNDPESWAYSFSCTASKAEVNGAEVGKPHWYRVEAVNAKGQSPWSEAAARPVK